MNHQDIAEILLKVVLNTIKKNLHIEYFYKLYKIYIYNIFMSDFV